MKAKVYVTLKPSILDPQGKTIAQALHTMGYDTINDVRQGKFFELDIGGDSAEAVRKTALEVAERVLANPVIENCRVEVE